MQLSDVRAIIERITYKDGWSIEVTDDWTLRVNFTAPDMITGEPFNFRGRRWPVRPDNTEDEIVGTAFLSIKIAEEHEVMEFFKLDGVSIFNPHITPAARKIAFSLTFPE